MNSIDDDWELFLESGIDNHRSSDIISSNNLNNHINKNIIIPKSSDLYVSTKTKITYLNVSENIDLYDIFWKIPILEYHQMTNGVIKKQMKFNLSSEKELEEVNNFLEKENYHKTDIIHVNKYNHGKTQIFKDVRKISVGLSKKDIISYRSKQKSAFYNCFVLILRINIRDKFKEVHVKIFNTGKIEIPGIQDDETYNNTLSLIIDILKGLIKNENLTIPDTSETVLINSNFRCGYYIDREKLYKILKSKYNINATYDSCSYPGIQCKYNIDVNHNISFMIFRTGSVLIVGKCEMETLNVVYDFLVKLLHDEYSNVSISNIYDNVDEKISSEKKSKTRKKIIYLKK